MLLVSCYVLLWFVLVLELPNLHQCYTSVTPFLMGPAEWSGMERELLRVYGLWVSYGSNEGLSQKPRYSKQLGFQVLHKQGTGHRVVGGLGDRWLSFTDGFEDTK